jgi:tRNA 2-thiouridine synthesizing protein E
LRLFRAAGFSRGEPVSPASGNPEREMLHPKEVGMAETTFKDRTFEMDDDGFLLRYEDWCPEWVEYVKESEGIAEITEDHTRILDFLREYYKKNGIAPMVRIISKNTGYKLKEVYELFPSGPGKGACRMAGLPKPTGCV